MSSEGRWPPLDPSPSGREPGAARPPGRSPGSPWEPRRAARPRRPAPEPEPDPDGASRRLLVAAALVLVGLGAAVLLQQGFGGGGEQSGGATGGGWAAERFGNSGRLASDGENVCSTTPDQVLFCLDAATGDERFTRQLYDSVVSSPVLAGGHVLVAGSGWQSTGRLHALALDGTDRWSLPLDAPTDRRMAVVGDVVAVVSGDIATGELVGIDAAAGTELWRVYSAADGSQPHVVSANAFTDGSRVYASIVTDDPGAASGIAGHVVAVDPRSGDEIWRSPSLPGITRSRGLAGVAALDGGAVAVLLEGTPDQEEGTPGQVVVLDAATGEERWQVEVESLHAAVGHVDGHTVVVDGAEMRAYDGEGGAAWAAPVPGHEAGGEAGPSTLVPVAGRLLHAGRDLHAVDPATGAGELVDESGTTSDLTVAGDHVVVAGVFALTALPVDEVAA